MHIKCLTSGYSDVKFNSLNEFYGYVGGTSFDRKNKDYAKVGKNILNAKHYPVFEHFSFTFDFEDSSRYFLYELTKDRVVTVTANSQRRLISKSYLIPEDPSFISLYDYNFSKYKELITNKSRKEDARFVLPNAIHTTFSLTGNVRELNYLVQKYRNIDNDEFKSFVSILTSFLQENDCYFEEHFNDDFNKSVDIDLAPRSLSDCLDSEFSVTVLSHTDYNVAVAFFIPVAIWMQFIRHRLFHICYDKITPYYLPIITENIDHDILNKYQSDSISNPYSVLGGQFVTGVLSGPLFAWKHFMQHRRDDKTAQALARHYAEILGRKLSI